MSDFPILETDRLVLKLVQSTDAPALSGMASSSACTAFGRSRSRRMLHPSGKMTRAAQVLNHSACGYCAIARGRQ